MAVLVTTLAVVVALLAVIVAGLLRSHAAILDSLRAGPLAPPSTPSRPACDLTGVSPAGAAIAISVVDTPGPTVVLFLSSTCTTCGDFWSALSSASRRRALDGTRLVVVTKGPDAENGTRLRSLAPRDVPVLMSTAAWGAYSVSVGPHFVLVDGATGGIVREGPVSTWEDLVSAVEQASSLPRSEI
jgi:hypothetical protein